MKKENEITSEIIKPDNDFFQLVQVAPHDDQPIRISSYEFAIRFWIFEYRKVNGARSVSLKGLFNPGILDELRAIGFRKRYDDKNNLIFIREERNIITEVSIPNIKDAFYEGCVKSQKNPIVVAIDGKPDTFSPELLHTAYLNRQHLIFNDKFLHHLDTHDKPILRDEKDCSYFPFRNVIVKTSKVGIDTMDYSLLGDRVVWEEHISKYSFFNDSNFLTCHFSSFITNVANQAEDRKVSFGAAIGYLLHNYNLSTGGQVVIVYDEKPAAKGQPQGGTGKGVFIKALQQIRNVTKIDGKKYRTDDKFKWQNVTLTTQIVWLDDVHSKFPFEDLHSNSTDGWNIEAKYKTEIYLPAAESPKIFIASNTILTNAGSTNKRRQFIIEFSDHYSKHIITGVEEPIKKEHGCTFFDEDEWDQSEWNKFFTYLLECSVLYFRKGLVPYEYRGLAKNQLLQSTNEDFAEWVEDKELTIGERYNLKELFDEFKKNYYGEDSDLKQRVFTNWLKEWAGIMGKKIEKVKSNGGQYIAVVTK